MSDQYFYADANRAARGPYTLAQLGELHSRGVIKAGTKVIQKGSKDWIAYSELKVQARATPAKSVDRTYSPAETEGAEPSFFSRLPKPVFFALVGALGCVMGAVLAEMALLLFPSAEAAAPRKPNICLLIDTSLSMAQSETPPSPSVQHIAILIDTSGSMRGEKLKQVKSASGEFVARQIAANRQFAVVRFGSDARTDQVLTGKPQSVAAAIDGFFTGGTTRLDLGLEETKIALNLNQGGSSKKVQNFVVIFTDGQSDRPRIDLNVAKDLRDAGVTLLAIYTPDADRDHLIRVTGDKNLVFPASAGSFGDAFKKVEEFIEGKGKTADASQVGADSKIAKVKVASTSFVKRQEENQLNIAVLHFGDDASVAQKLTTNTGDITRAIDGLKLKGETALHLGLEKTKEELPLESGDTMIGRSQPDKPTDYVVVFTDGKPNDEEAALAVAQKLKDAGVQIYAIHTADAPSDYLAKLTGDPARVISTTSRGIDEAFKVVEEAINPSAGIAISSAGGKVESFLKNGTWFALLAMALALALTWAQNKLTAGGGATRGMSGGQFFTALVIGAVAGFAAGGINLLFNQLSVNQWAVFSGGVMAWGLLAALIGLAMIFVIANFTAGRAIAGGLIGGLVGGVIFNAIRLAQGEGGSATGEMVGRVLGAMMVGAMIGLFIAWIEQLTRKAWLAIYWTPKQHSTINLGEKPVTVGGGQDDIRIKGLAERALSIVLSQGKVICTQQPGNKNMELKDQSSIKLGKVRLMVHAKTVK